MAGSTPPSSQLLGLLQEGVPAWPVFFALGGILMTSHRFVFSLPLSLWGDSVCSCITTKWLPSLGAWSCLGDWPISTWGTIFLLSTHC